LAEAQAKEIRLHRFLFYLFELMKAFGFWLFAVSPCKEGSELLAVCR
jgi:hypothetical protein